MQAILRTWSGIYIYAMVNTEVSVEKAKIFRSAEPNRARFRYRPGLSVIFLLHAESLNNEVQVVEGTHLPLPPDPLD